LEKLRLEQNDMPAGGIYSVPESMSACQPCSNSFICRGQILHL